MTDRLVTPEQARELISHVEGCTDCDYTTIDMLVDTDMHRLVRLTRTMAEMLAGAHCEYAVARKNGSTAEYLDQFWEWRSSPDLASWITEKESMELMQDQLEEDEYVVTRLVVNPEEDD